MHISIHPLVLSQFNLLKQIILACLVAASLAAPKHQDNIAILRDDRDDQGDGNFNYAFELSDGTAVEASGFPGAEGAVNIRGAYRFNLPDGAVVQITYVADENGFQPEGDIIPTPHPLPAHAIEQIRFAEEQRAAGVVFE
ncbi:cuticle protein AM1199-like [Palaemon carinicauda]|uniref:cuticle protein AM1199-like n=1 Tax=Palaemon carinicauda TaxID=392227 RepID=UPI0035B6565F